MCASALYTAWTVLLLSSTSAISEVTGCCGTAEKELSAVSCGSDITLVENSSYAFVFDNCKRATMSVGANA